MELTVRPTVMMAIVAVALLAHSFTTDAYDPSPLQNICVADNSASSVLGVNGKVCKNPNLVTVDDFVVSGLQIPGDTNKFSIGSVTKIVDVNNLPGLNTLGISLLRADISPPNNSVSPLHVHPLATEILIVLEGTMYAGFIDSTPGGTKSKLFAKILKPGDVFVIPIGLIHLATNVGNTTASVISAFNSQEFGFIRIANYVFGSDQPIPSELLAKSFQLDTKEVEHLQSISWNF